MEQKLINEKQAFNSMVGNIPVYIDCIRRNISKKTPAPIYHYHNEIELLYCVEGELEVTLYSKSIILKKGDFLYVAPNTPHATYAYSKENEHICVKFVCSVLHVPTSRKIPPEDYFLSLVSNYEYFPNNALDHENIKNLFFSCHKYFSHDDYFMRLHLVACIMQIMSYVFDHTVDIPAKETPKEIADVFINVLDYVDKNYATITLQEAANFCSLSYSYFSRTFKSIFNISFSNYVIKKRVEKSLTLISNSKLSLNDIALECGFANLSHFIKCFNETTGMTPKKFRMAVTEK